MSPYVSMLYSIKENSIKSLDPQTETLLLLMDNNVSFEISQNLIK